MKQYRTAALCIFAIVAVSAFSQISKDAVRSALTVCTTLLIPSLFPYLVLTNLFVRSGAADRLGRRLSSLFRFSGSAVTTFTLGILGGYPLGAKTAAELRKSGVLSQAEAQQALSVCNNAGISFFLGVLGTLLGSPAAGIALYAVHAVSAILAGCILNRNKKPQIEVHRIRLPEPFSSAFTKSVVSAAETMLSICAFVTFFSVITALLSQITANVPFLTTALTALLELTGGAMAIAALPIGWHVKLSLLSAATAWGGLCVHFQSVAALSGSGISVKPYLKAKALQAAISLPLAFAASYLIKPVAEASVTPHRFVPVSPLPWCVLSAGIFFLIFLQIPTGNSEKNVL